MCNVLLFTSGFYLANHWLRTIPKSLAYVCGSVPKDVQAIDCRVPTYKFHKYLFLFFLRSKKRVQPYSDSNAQCKKGMQTFNYLRAVWQTIGDIEI